MQQYKTIRNHIYFTETTYMKNYISDNDTVTLNILSYIFLGVLELGLC